MEAFPVVHRTKDIQDLDLSVVIPACSAEPWSAVEHHV